MQRFGTVFSANRQTSRCKIQAVVLFPGKELVMTNEFTNQVSQRICNHMNKDHGDAVVIYAQEYGGLSTAIAAQMVSIDAEGMDLNAQVNNETVPVRVKFDHVLADAEDAHHTLVAMLKASKTSH